MITEELHIFGFEGYEYLRQLEYKISILRDKLDYLGEKYCNDLEKELANLTDFPPLNYCFYPSVPEKYLVPRGQSVGANRQGNQCYA